MVARIGMLVLAVEHRRVISTIQSRSRCRIHFATEWMLEYISHLCTYLRSIPEYVQRPLPLFPTPPFPYSAKYHAWL